MYHDYRYNGSGYWDGVAATAIEKADKQPDEVGKTIKLIRYIADWCGFEIEGRICLKDKQTGKRYR